MAEPLSIKDLPRYFTGSMVRSNRVVLCDRCHGFGFNESEDLVDYHKREYTTSRSVCKRCEGDGRLIETIERVSINHGGDKVNKNPYITAKEYTDPHGYEDQWFRYRLDMTDRELERKYPELAAISYDKYDEMVEKYRTLEALKKDYTV